MNALIIDDNRIARETLRQLATQVADLTVAAECASAMEAYNFLRKGQADLLLLDIEMPGMTGLELTETLGDKRPVIVFVTSKRDYAVEAYELNVADYLVKPVLPARFVRAIDRVREVLNSNREETSVQEDEFVFIRDGGVMRRLKLDHILYAEAMGDYVKLHTPERFYAAHTTLKNLEERLPAHRFLRVHRSYIVAVDKIDTLQDGALVINGKAVPVADAYRNTLNGRMNIL
ncbi:LytR/AlgR family response regulator transcription factor [Dinghuibacter silviterrae]|uniref:LytTR family two component transcriptional regulator n=1 Tax=Dinghuibacter silviterrae TaxID=1539049 RepID=A0A4R8DTZ4_9BACT|nr:LytTR family DNA-binding domain-containing protein [Dinghuibacter silviterrae]TDX00887.1 LytTR family two component transcriptional regulator [Dinghuibacter silviterrae]